MLPEPERIEMLVPSPFEYDASDGVAYFCQAMETGAQYVLALHCIECGRVKHFFGSPRNDSLQGEQMYQLARLDERMKPWIAEHVLCQYAVPLPGFEAVL